jgi:hypothetical protein
MYRVALAVLALSASAASVTPTLAEDGVRFALAQEPALCWDQAEIACDPPVQGKTCWRQIPAPCLTGTPVSTVTTEPKRPRMTVGAGALASLGGGRGGVSVQPLAQLAVSAPLYEHPQDLATRLEVDASLTALPGQTINLTDARTFRALEFTGRLCQPLSTRLYFAPCVEAGFATRLSGDAEPRFRAARWFALTVKVSAINGDFLAAGISADERLDAGGQFGPYYRPAALISGSVGLVQAGESKIMLRLVGSAVLHLRIGSEVYTESPPDRIVLGVMVAR